MAWDTAHATQRTQRAHRLTGAKGPRTPNAQCNAPSRHIGEQEPSGPGHRTRNTTHRAGTLANRSQVAQDTAHATQCTERAHPRTGAKWPRTPHTKHNAPSEHTGEQEPSGPGHRTGNTTHPASTPVNRSQVAQDTAHATQRTERAQWRTGAKWPRTLHTQRNARSEHIQEQEPSGPGHRTRNTTHQASTPANRSQVAQDTAQATQRTQQADR